MFCSACHQQEENGAKFCSKCGQPLIHKDLEEVNLKFCPDCGNKRESHENFCASCGFSYAGFTKAYQEAATTTVASGGASLEFNPEKTHGQVYASFGQRFAASIIDFIILLVFSLIIGLIFIGVTGSDVGLQLMGMILGVAYKAGMESSSYQGTFGKKAMGIKVTDLQGKRISFGRAVGRYFASYLSALLLGIGYLCALFTAKKQTLHDLMAGTVVQK